MNKQQLRQLKKAGRKPVPSLSRHKMIALSTNKPESEAVSVSGSNAATITADELLERAKRTIDSAIISLRPAAEDIAAARDLGATQREIAAAVGMSLGWVNALLKWRRNGYQDSTPFGRPRLVQPLNKSDAQMDIDVSSSNVSASADPIAVAASAGPHSPHLDTPRGPDNPEERNLTETDRARLVKALGLLGSDQAGERENAALAAERLRQGLQLTWDQLIVPAGDSSDVETLLAQTIT